MMMMMVVPLGLPSLRQMHACSSIPQLHWATSLFGTSLLLSPKFGLSPKLSQKVKSIFLFGLSPNFGLSEKLSESLSPKFGLSPKLI